MNLLNELGLTWLDAGAVLTFGVAWFAYAAFADYRAHKVPNLHTRMDHYRREWMVRMIGRDNRMVDVQIMRILSRNSQFFASTTMLVLGALIALTGYIQQALELSGGVVADAARLLSLQRTTLIEKMRKYDLNAA